MSQAHMSKVMNGHLSLYPFSYMQVASHLLDSLNNGKCLVDSQRKDKLF